MEGWSFLSKHGRVLLCIAHDPGVRLRDIAASVGITERSVYGIVTDLTAAGCMVKEKDGRRNRYQIQAHLPLPEPTSQHLAIGKVLALLAGASTERQLTGGNPAEATTASRTGLRLRAEVTEPKTRPGEPRRSVTSPPGAATGSVVSCRGQGTLDRVPIRSDPAGSGAPGPQRPGGRSSEFSQGGTGCA
jgi:hypothetical protein